MTRDSVEKAVLKSLKAKAAAPPTPVELTKVLNKLSPSAVSVAIQRLVERDEVDIGADWTLRLK